MMDRPSTNDGSASAVKISGFTVSNYEMITDVTVV